MFIPPHEGAKLREKSLYLLAGLVCAHKAAKNIEMTIKNFVFSKLSVSLLSKSCLVFIAIICSYQFTTAVAKTDKSAPVIDSKSECSNDTASSVICICDIQGYNQLKTKFPPMLQSLPLKLTTDSLIAKAAIQIRSAGSSLKMDGAVWSVIETSQDETIIKKMCFDNGKLKLKLGSGKVIEAALEGNSISYRGATLVKSDDVTYRKIATAIENHIGDGSSVGDSGQSTSGSK